MELENFRDKKGADITLEKLGSELCSDGN